MMLFITTRIVKISDLGWMYTLFFVLLGIAAAGKGGWLERVRTPRKAGLVFGCLAVRRSVTFRGRGVIQSSIVEHGGCPGRHCGIGLGLLDDHRTGVDAGGVF